MQNDPATEKLALEYAPTIFRALRQQTENITTAMIASSAMPQVLAEKFPEFGERYERFREDASNNSPLSAKSRAMCAQFDDIVKQLEKLKA